MSDEPIDIAAVSKAAREAAGELQRETDRLNAALEIAERKLQHLELGVTAHVTLPSNITLHFRKANDGWGLFVCHGTDEFTHMLHVSRRTRAEIGLALPRLLVALHQEVQRQTASVAKAATAVEGWEP